MAWYVFALVDAPPAKRLAKGLSGPLGLRRVGDAFAVVERREDVPPAEFGTLQRHHDVVTQMGEHVPAILPVRFGTLLDTDALEEALEERDEDLHAAFTMVRNRVQFSWRRHQPRRPTARPSDARSAASGTEYLRRAARAARPAPPAAWRTIRAKLTPLIVSERYQPAGANLPDSLYHLVDRDHARRYATLAAALLHANPALTMSGPFPPFAFAAELL